MACDTKNAKMCALEIGKHAKPQRMAWSPLMAARMHHRSLSARPLPGLSTRDQKGGETNEMRSTCAHRQVAHVSARRYGLRRKVNLGSAAP